MCAFGIIYKSLKTSGRFSSAVHLFGYLDQQSFSYNNRKNMGNKGRFEAAMFNVSGNRLTYSALTGAETSR